MMQKEMPRKYWRNLPEAQFIAPLASRAHERSGTMIEQPATQPRRRIPLSPVPVRAAEVVAQIETLADLSAATQRCRECPIGALATQAVPGEGPMQAAVMFVGEQPGDQEDLRGRPFVGPAGQLFDRALARLNVDREKIFVTNAVRHFKYELRGKRRIHKTPAQQ
jgi:DNA polymerase